MLRERRADQEAMESSFFHAPGIGARALLSAALSVASTLGGLDIACADEPNPVELRWEVPEGAGCPSTETLSHDVEERLGRSVFGNVGTARAFIIAGRMRRSEAGWEVELDLVDREGHVLGRRRLVSPSAACASLARSIAIVLSLLVDQHAQEIVLYEPAPSPALPEGTQPPSSRPTLDDTASDAPQWRVSVALGAQVTGFGLPGPAWGTEQLASVGVPGWPLSIAIEGAIHPAFAVRSADGQAEVWFWLAGVFACPELLELPELRMVTCAGATAGVLHARGTEFDVSRAVAGAYVEIGIRAGVEIRLIGPLRLRLVGLFGVPALRPDLVFGAPGEERVLYATGLVSAGAALSLMIAWPAISS